MTSLYYDDESVPSGTYFLAPIYSEVEFQRSQLRAPIPALPISYNAQSRIVTSLVYSDQSHGVALQSWMRF